MKDTRTAHTPGPWTCDEPSNWHGLDARVFVPEPYGVVAQVPIEAWRPRSIGRANARLIAAAPELLGALKIIVSDFETDYVLDGKVVDDPPAMYQRAWRLAVSAIAKAVR